MNMVPVLAVWAVSLFGGDGPAPAGAADFELAQASRVERHRMNLGGASGQYTDWERNNIANFAGLRTSIDIQKTHGRPRDKWAAIARVNLHGAKDAAGDSDMLSVVLRADRRSGGLTAIVHHFDAAQPVRLEFDGRVGQAVELSMRMRAVDQLELELDQSRFMVELPTGFRVGSIAVIGSGVDVRFEPFDILYD